MKKLLLLLFIYFYIPVVNAQNKSAVDKEKVLDYFQTQRYGDAALYLQSVFKENTTEPKELSQIAYAFMMAGKLSDAEKYYEKLHELQPENISTLFSLANINNRRSNSGKTKDYLVQVLKIDSTNFNAYKQLASLSKENALIAEQINYMVKANKLNPTEPEVAYDLAEFYFKANLFDQAEKILNPAIAADSNNLQLLKMKMPILMGGKKYKESILTGEKIMSYGDSSTFVLTNMGKSHFLQLEYQKALNYFLKVSEVTKNETLFYNISLSYRGLKDYKNAITYLQKTIDLAISPNTASYYGLLGDSFENVDKNLDANVAYKRGLLFKNNGSLYYNIALVYETKLNDKKNAISYYNQYLKSINAEEQPKLITFIKNKIEDLKR